MPDFIAHRHPVLAVRCRECGKAVGLWCVPPSGHRASELHVGRRIWADRVFVDQHGMDARTEHVAGEWTIDPRGRVGIRPQPETSDVEAKRIR